MQKRHLCSTLIALTCASLLAACGGAEENPVIAERQEHFKSLGGANKAIGDELKKPEPSVALIQENVATIIELAPQIPTWFPDGTSVDSGADTEALAAIWQQPDDFAAAADNLHAKASALAETAAGGDLEIIRNAAGEVGPACRNCHDSFRLKDD